LTSDRAVFCPDYIVPANLFRAEMALMDAASAAL